MTNGVIRVLFLIGVSVVLGSQSLSALERSGEADSGQLPMQIQAEVGKDASEVAAVADPDLAPADIAARFAVKSVVPPAGNDSGIDTAETGDSIAGVLEETTVLAPQPDGMKRQRINRKLRPLLWTMLKLQACRDSAAGNSRF